MTVALRPVIRPILDEYALPIDGDHGISQWTRVSVNGLRLAAANSANTRVVQLFAIFYDSKRVNECTGPDRCPNSVTELRISSRTIAWPSDRS